MDLYTYFRSSAAYRVRIALALKGLEYRSVPVHLGRGEQAAPPFRAVNPQGLVPVLDDDGTVVGQSLAILEYLDETNPWPPLLPADAPGRARVRRLALMVACDIHPLNNLRVLNHLRGEAGFDEAGITRWVHHWITEGFDALEALLEGAAGRFCHGDVPTLADICLVPQVFNARRFGMDVAAWPTILRVDAACRTLPAFAAAAPERQPDHAP